MQKQQKQNAQENHNSTHLDSPANLTFKHDIIKYKFTQFCKQNTHAIALLLKALLQGAKHYPKATLEQAFLQGHCATESKSDSIDTTLKTSSGKDSMNSIAKTSSDGIKENPINAKSNTTTPKKPAPLNLEG
ncbi:hypothetical protein [Helicobacter turcicus]|uniref:Uncharacterized protein n=1 Tax=Helicobacter turcicus TaxID=2867412 RepID=A0ABS7JLL0_9HELI|nr:hypothetical protein [Helicobacter turcicus]MBX7490276.1 hypothetical protein [Helicobacter turcicus]MBX7545145.1 hypothetical protein [Helicobacter turcicus]